MFLFIDDNSSTDGWQNESSIDVFYNGCGHSIVSLPGTGAFWLYKWGLIH